ncbi:MAG: ATP-binding domain-containing protein [Corynebacterium sp.]|nr:ATP-binding domain-containing protein [Corynebacterium sp.]
MSTFSSPNATTRSNAAPLSNTEAVSSEQQVVDTLFDFLDQEVITAQQRLKEVMLQVDFSTPDAEALVRRETEYHSLQDKIDRLNIAQLGLVFGRIDIDAQGPKDNPVAENPDLDRRYIGRLGLIDTADDYRTLLLDWRAPQARPFYLATTANPEGVHTRRHIRTTGRKVTRIDDEVLAGEDQLDSGSDVVSESALHQALQAARTAHMNSIVETIQREQDAIIRDPSRGIVVVEGGPGTGKTAVALHRVAYLLYTWREQLAKTGVLIVGPSPTFLEYISRVLPELGETGVVLQTIGQLYPGINPQARESLLAREVKGSIEMVTILKRLVQDYQQIPTTPRHFVLEGINLEITPATIKAARTRARRSRKPHNEAAGIFQDHLAELLARQLQVHIGTDPLGGENLLGQADVDELHDDILTAPQFSELANDFWPLLTPTQVLTSFYGDPQQIARVAYDYDEETQHALWREHPEAYTASDAALLDELAELIGVLTPEDAAAQAQEQWRQHVEDAAEALDILTSSANTDLDDETEAEILSAHDVIDAAALASRHETQDSRTTAQRAQADLRWAYGHVVIDEAQELSPMEWRMVMRRSPSRWMTIVGDVAQTGAPAGVDDWQEALRPFVQTRFRHHQLTVNYRTPKTVTELANAISAQYLEQPATSTALRDTEIPLSYVTETTPEVLADVITTLHSRYPQRLVQFIAPDAVAASLQQTNPELPVLGVSAAKGLEFDHVVVIDAARIVEASPQGWQDLYVAATRATQSLVLAGPWPASLDASLAHITQFFA